MPKIKTIPNSCAKCTDARLPNKSYCRAHWNEYMRAHACQRRRTAHAGSPYHCARCEIKIRAARGLCADCAKNAPLIQTSLLLGDARYWLKNEPRGNAFADIQDTRRRKTTRTTKPSKYD